MSNLDTKSPKNFGMKVFLRFRSNFSWNEHSSGDHPEDIDTARIIRETEDVVVQGDVPCEYCHRLFLHKTTCELYKVEKKQK